MIERREHRHSQVVLIADDDFAMRLLERESLEQEGFIVEEAADGPAAVRVFQRVMPDVVLLDVIMPEMDGYEVCREIRRIPGAENIPILMVTGLDDIDSINRAYEVGATSFISKPITWGVLPHHVKYVLRSGKAFEALRDSEEALKSSEERYALAARGANDGLWDWNLRTGEIFYSARWKEIIGLDGEIIMNRIGEWFSRVHPDDIERLKLFINAHLEGTTKQLHIEYRMMHRDGEPRWILTRGIAVRDDGGTYHRMVGSQTDVNERKLAEERLVYNALYDVLTGLPNRALMLDRVSHAMKRRKRQGDFQYAVLFIDLDRFKVVNDSLGHAVGDQLLIAISRRLERALRDVDTLARLGGDEFVVLAEDIRNGDEASVVAERMLKALTTSFHISGHEIYVSASIGITIGSDRYDKPDAVIRDADIAMYRAKADGKSRYEVFDETMHLQALAVMQLENDMRKAVDRGEFVLYYQPIMSLHGSGQFDALEALIRWNHPKRGLLQPCEFIHLAEETGLIVPIGDWVIRTACERVRQWHDELKRPIRLAVNVSAREVKTADFAQRVKIILEETGYPPEWLDIEITESLILGEYEMVSGVFEQLRSLGISIAIDDFGTGYSSFGYLNKFAIDKVKIDRQFISKIGREKNALDIINAILELARKMDLAVTAEGIETDEQCAGLKFLNCPLGQGYRFSRPLDSAEIEALLKRPIFTQ